MRGIGEKIPVTVITGFLGAGKTTFINKLLKKYAGLKFALVENEFGEAAIDIQLIKGVDASRMFELKKGCICCTISDEYEMILLELAERFPEIEHVLIETTGVADPVGVISPLLRDERLKSKYQYNGCICIVDAMHYGAFKEEELFEKQIAAADHILLNKTDLVSANDGLIQAVQVVNPLAKITEVLYGDSKNIFLEDLQTIAMFSVDQEEKHVHSHIQSKTIFFREPVEREKFLNWLTYNLDIYKQSIYRTKGIVYFQDEPFEYLIQGVGGSFEISEHSLVTGENIGRLVFIGKLDEIQLDL